MSWTTIAPLVISVVGLIVSAWTATRNVRIQRAQSRTDLLLKTVDLRLAYASFNRRIRRLRENPPSPMPNELQALLAAEGGFREFERKTESYYEAIARMKYDVAEFERLRLNTEYLLKQLEDDNRRLDGILESLPSSTRPQSVNEKFNVLKQRVMHVLIINELPVELHALREFIVENGLTQDPPFRHFYEKWLTRTPVLIGVPAPNAFSREEIEDMRSELSPLER